MPSLRTTFIAYLSCLTVFMVGATTAMDFNNMVKLYLFYVFSCVFLLWGILLLRSYLRPKVNIKIVSDNWPDNSIQFKIWGEERELDINRKLIVTGYLIDPTGENHNKKKAKYEYIIDGDDLKVGFQAKDFIARGSSDYFGDRGFLYFKTFIFSFIGGGGWKKRCIYNVREEPPLSLRKYLTAVYQYKKYDLIPQRDKP